jgi:hypothetical protein
MEPETTNKKWEEGSGHAVEILITKPPSTNSLAVICPKNLESSGIILNDIKLEFLVP